MELLVFETKKEASTAAAEKAARIIKTAIKSKGLAVIVAATGKSQLIFLKKLVQQPLDWSKVSIFHLDEYLGISQDNPASLRYYLNHNLIGPAVPKKFYPIAGDAKDPKKECRRLNRAIASQKIDLTFLGVGKNGHLAFNDPPADFKAETPFRIVELSKETREQAVERGWFTKRSKVPKRAISMSIHQIMKSEKIICLAFGKEKTKAIGECLAGKISPSCPASILQKHKNSFVYLDKKASSRLDRTRYQIKMSV